jgi:hypothetical protein
MTSARCPGRDQRYWTPDDIFDVGCPYCGCEIEFWKDEAMRRCRECGREVRNPRIDLECAEWCGSADDCLGRAGHGGTIAAPILERLAVELERRFSARPEVLVRARQVCSEADGLLGGGEADPRLAKPAALLVGAATGCRSRDGEATADGDRRLLDTRFLDDVLKRVGLGEGEASAVTTIVAIVLSDAPTTGHEALLVRSALKRVLVSEAAEEADTVTDVGG